MSSVTLEVYDPSGALEVDQNHASRLPDLRGKTIAEFSDRVWEGHRTFPQLRKLLREKISDLKIIPYEQTPHVYLASAEELRRAVRENKCDAVIIGNAS